MSKRAASMILGGILTFAGIFFAYAVAAARGSSRYDPGPAFFPRLAAVALAVLGIYTLCHEYFHGERTVIEFLNLRIILGILAMAVYAVLLWWTGYVIAGIFIAGALMLAMCTDAMRQVWGRLLLVGILAPVLIYLIFAKYLLVPLPSPF